MSSRPVFCPPKMPTVNLQLISSEGIPTDRLERCAGIPFDEKACSKDQSIGS